MYARLIGVFVTLSFIYVLGITPIAHSATDTTAPVVTSIGAFAIASNSVQIKWTTDDLSDSTVNYGVTRSANPGVSTDRCDGGGYVTSHCVNITALTAGTIYYYMVSSTNSAGLSTLSPTATPAPSFTTLAITANSTDTTAPVITHLRTEEITSYSAKVKWDTDDISDSHALIASNLSGTATNYATQRCDGSGYVTSHCVYITNLAPAMIYNVKIDSINTSGMDSFAYIDPFTTASIAPLPPPPVTTAPPPPPPVTTAPPPPPVIPPPPPPPDVTTVPPPSPVVTVQPLPPVPTSTAASDTTAPVITNVEADDIGSYRARIRWNTDDKADSSVTYGNTISGNATSNDRCDGGGYVSSHCVYINNLTPGTSYNYKVQSVNASGLNASSYGTAFTTIPLTTQMTTTSTAPIATPITAPITAIASTTSGSTYLKNTIAPVITEVRAANITSFGAQIKWNTDQPADSRVVYGTVSLDQHSSDTRCDGGGFVSSHCVTLSSLLPGMPFYFRVTSMNSIGLSGYSGGYSFTSLPLSFSPTLETRTNTSGGTMTTSATESPSSGDTNMAIPQTITPSSSVVASSTVALESGLQTSIALINTVVKKESGVTVDLSPTTRPIADIAPQQPTEQAPLQELVTQRIGADVYTDSDGDGIADYDEANLYHTNPQNAHTGGSALTDGERLSLGLDPLTSSAARVPVESPVTAGTTRTDIFEVSVIDVHNVPIVVATSSPVRPVAATKIVPVAKATTTVSLPTSKQEVSFAGKALPNSFVTLFIFSTPIVVTVKTDISGAWKYTLDTELPDGQHELYVATVDAGGKILAKSPAIPFTKTAEAAEFSPLTIIESPTVTPLDIFRNNMIFIGLVAFGLFAVIALAILGVRRSEAKKEEIASV